MAREVYRAIMIAAAKAKGLRLTADEVHELSMDCAISTRAAWLSYRAALTPPTQDKEAEK